MSPFLKQVLFFMAYRMSFILSYPLPTISTTPLSSSHSKNHHHHHPSYFPSNLHPVNTSSSLFTTTSSWRTSHFENESTFWLQILLIVALVLAGGLFAGLTLGLLSLDLTSLDVLVQSGDPNEKYYATLIKPIRKQGHWLLVTLLLANVIVNETLPILTDTLWGGGWPAVMISTTLIVIFGEIIPQAICSRYGLAIGANFRWVVQFLMILFSPIAYPISKLLDYSLGKTKGYTYKRAELKALVALHEKSEAHFGPLNTDEVTIIKAVLELRDKNVRTIMTPLEDTYMLSTEQLLDETKIQEIVDKGYSRIPVYRGHERKHILGMLLVKKLASYDPHLQWKVKEFCHAIAPLPIVSPQSACFETLDLFQTGRSHMAIVANGDVPFGSTCELDKEKTQMDVLGIVTLEDILEEMIGEEIIDETDIYVDVTLKLPVPRLKSVRFSNPGLTTNLTVPMHYPKLIQRSSEFSVHSLSEDQDKKPLLSS